MRIALNLHEEKALQGLSLSFLKKVTEKTLCQALPSIAKRDITFHLEVASVSEREIQKLNKKYQKKDESTDILSFGHFQSAHKIAHLRQKIIELGQIVIAPDYIRRSAKEDGVSWRHEFIFVFSHGVLHLLGYDHSPRMFAHQDKVTDRLIHNG